MADNTNKEGKVAVSRRGFFGLVGGAAAATAASVAVVPAGAAVHPAAPLVDKPKQAIKVLQLEAGYITDPEWMAPSMPLCAEHFDPKGETEGMSPREFREWYAEEVSQGDETPEDLDDEGLFQTRKEIAEWRRKRVADEWEGGRDQYQNWRDPLETPYDDGFEIMRVLGEHQCEELELREVWGDHPGSSLHAVRLDGDVEVLNARLAALGLGWRVLGEKDWRKGTDT